jgi:leader peptidase (prepilin peptidase) / N-methyltransferase
VEAVTMSATVPLAWTVHDPLVLAAFLVFAVAGTALAFIDLAVHRLPDRLTLPAFTAAATLLVVDAAWQHRLGDIAAALAGAAGSAGVYLVLALIAGGGAGDVKLALGTGLVLGWHGLAAVLLGVVAGFAFTSLCAAVMVAARRLKRGDHIAHGSGMLAAALVVTIIAAAGGC